MTVNPRRASQDKKPWRSLDLTTITGQTIETRHLHDVHLGENLVPYATLAPLKAILPLKRGDTQLPANTDGVGGVNLRLLDRRMRDRWRTISALWEENKQHHNKLDLLTNLDHYGKLSSQLKWQQDPGNRPVRVVYTRSGTPTAALLLDVHTLLDTTTYWITCKNTSEAHYLLAIINSDALYKAVTPLMSKGQFGARDLHKHLWKLPIPEFDPGEPLHAALSNAGQTVADAAARHLTHLQQTLPRVTVTIARRELRKWLRSSPEGKVVEETVGRLLAG